MSKGENWTLSFLCALGIVAVVIACYGWIQRPTFLKEFIVFIPFVGTLGVLSAIFKRILFHKETDPDKEVI